ncbi:MAG: hypothetical protein RIA08_09670 [Roseovarius sp.]|uniref:hypothetical protein n=1 Tax=Roseovarius sp. TaxID=1486281 RepID=UPI0032EF0082
MSRMTLVVPAAHCEAGAHVHVLMGKAPALTTYANPSFEDGQGNSYAVSSGLWTPEQIVAVQDPAILDREDLQALYIENGGIVDRSLCETAQGVFEVYDPENPVAAAPERILAIVHDVPKQALEWAGVSRVEAEAI